MKNLIYLIVLSVFANFAFGGTSPNYKVTQIPNPPDQRPQDSEHWGTLESWCSGRIHAASASPPLWYQIPLATYLRASKGVYPKYPATETAVDVTAVARFRDEQRRKANLRML